MNEYIYHYTSLNNLALILKNRTIRFNRLDKVDDVTESSLLPRKLNNYYFVSCWTESEKENIPLWAMYTHEMNGVRIGIQKDMFRKHEISSRIYQGTIGDIGERFLSPFRENELITDNYMIVPYFDILDDRFYYPIIYEENYFNKYENLELITNSTYSVDNKIPGRYKSEFWKFQNESRFKIQVLPILKEGFLDKGVTYYSKLHSCGPAIQLNIPLQLNFIDVQLNDTAYNKMEILLGPKCHESNRILLDSLVSKYNPNCIIKDSKLLGKIN